MKKIWQQKHQILSQNLSINLYKKQNEKDINKKLITSNIINTPPSSKIQIKKTKNKLL